MSLFCRWCRHCSLCFRMSRFYSSYPRESKARQTQEGVLLKGQKISNFSCSSCSKVSQDSTTLARALSPICCCLANSQDKLSPIGSEWYRPSLCERTWTVPAIHMKRKTLFRVALSKRAIALIEPLMELDGYLFPGDKIGRPISSGTMHQTLKRTSGLDVTVHGFRSTFRDYIGEKTSFDYLTAEYALAHTPKDATVRAYARMDQLEKRLELMEAWGESSHECPKETWQTTN
jgi:hypothetical protein